MLTGVSVTRISTIVGCAVTLFLAAPNSSCPWVVAFPCFSSSLRTTPMTQTSSFAVQNATRRQFVCEPMLRGVAFASIGIGHVFSDRILTVDTAVAYPSEETPRVVTKMGGLLEPFQDGPRSIRMMAPSGWNRFEGEPGAYDLKWQDLVDSFESIKISSTPVKSSTDSIAVLGNVQDVGVSLATKRNAKLISATERLTDGILFYKFDFSLNDGTHQLLQLCVGKGKLWSVDASAKEKRWSKRADLYNNVLDSFMPKLA
jgi:photosystem II oxygen-evolving enhancer protein 2